jgi:hypothetical protein
MSTASATQKKDSAILSRSDLEELIQREAKPGSRLEDYGSICAFLRW